MTAQRREDLHDRKAESLTRRSMDAPSTTSSAAWHTSGRGWATVSTVALSARAVGCRCGVHVPIGVMIVQRDLVAGSPVTTLVIEGCCSCFGNCRGRGHDDGTSVRDAPLPTWATSPSGVALREPGRMEVRREQAARVLRPANNHPFEIAPRTVPGDGRNRSPRSPLLSPCRRCRPIWIRAAAEGSGCLARPTTLTVNQGLIPRLPPGRAPEPDPIQWRLQHVTPGRSTAAPAGTLQRDLPGARELGRL